MVHTTKTIKYLSFFCLISLILVFPKANDAQVIEQASARLEGTIQNPDKEPIPKAEIQLKHVDSGQIFYSKSNKKGEFSSGLIPPGNYALTVKKEGYKSYTGELELRSNAIQKLEVILAKEETSEQKKEKEAVSFFKDGTKFVGENKPEEAIQAFRKAIELKPDFAEAYMNIGILLFQGQKYDEAENAILKALELKPEEVKCIQILADINFEQAKKLIQENKLDDALEKLKKAYSLRPDHVYANFLLGYLYYKKQMKEEAIKHLEAFLQLAPDSPQAQQVKEILESLKKDF